MIAVGCLWSCLWIWLWICLWLRLCQLRASLTYFGDLLRCPHKPIVTITKIYTARNNVGPTSGINTIPQKVATLMTFETLRWKYTFATDVLITIRDEAPLVYRAPSALDVSEHSHLGTCHMGTSTIRVGTSTNSALILHYLLRLKLSTSTRERE